MMNKPVVLITGASRGIGAALAEKFASEGYAVALTARDMEKMQTLAANLTKSYKTETLCVPADLSETADAERLANAVLKEWGKVDVLINNAGILHARPFLEISADELQEMLDVNIRAVFLLTQKVVPGMVERKDGTIINIASLGGKNGFKGGTGYSATKFALRGFAQSLMQELRKDNVRVVTVFPGSVDTRLISRNPDAPDPASMLQAEDVAHAVFAAVSVDPRALMSEIDIRPLNPVKK